MVCEDEGSAWAQTWPVSGSIKRATILAAVMTFPPGCDVTCRGGTCCFLLPLSDAEWKRHPPLCHPDRSAAKWRDLQFSEMFFERALQLNLTTPSEGTRLASTSS